MIENEKYFETRTLKASTDLFNYREIRKVKGVKSAADVRCQQSNKDEIER